MNLDFTDDQRMLKDSVERLVTERYDFEARKAILATDTGWSREIWSALAELGLMMLPFSEEAGGLG